MILALAGGVGGAKLAKGLSEVLAPEELIVVVNTGDDFEHLGLHISPDLDTVMYTLAGINDPAQGWGIAGETWSFMQALGSPGRRDLVSARRPRPGDAHRAHAAAARGQSLSAVTQQLVRSSASAHRVVPMSDERVRTLVHTSAGVLAFQDYFVRRRAEPAVTQLEFAGAEQAHDVARPCTLALDSRRSPPWSSAHRTRT